METFVAVIVMAVTLAVALIVGVITWRRFDYFYLSRQKKYRHSPYELLKMKFEQTLVNMAVVFVVAWIVVHGLLNGE